MPTYDELLAQRRLNESQRISNVRARRKSEGKCISCEEKHEPKKTLCAVHLGYESAKQRRYRRQKVHARY